jgi:putative ABC transport system permease protein
MRFAVMKVDSSFARTHNIDRLRGRSFAMDARSYDGPSILINETAAELLGWEKPVGRSISYGGREGRIIGVVEDFHLTSLRKSIPPLILRPAHATGGYLTAHLTKEDVRSTLAFVEESWATMFPSRPFDFFFLDRAFDALYRSEKRIAHAVRWLAALTLLVAGMGLFGMAASVANLRMKEVSIRRALGATGWEVLRLLLKQILTPVAAGCVVAVPIAYALLHEWLSQFAYRIALRPSFFVITVILTIGAALLAVAYPSFRAIRSDPSQLLRQEA